MKTKKIFVLLGMFFLTAALAWGQNFKASGIVVDETGEPMIGAGVVQKGTTNGVITDIDGYFEINVPRGAVLEFSSVSFKTLELPAAEGMKVIMEEDREVLDEVVVVGYGVQRKSSVTGSISQVKSEDVDNRTIVSAEEALAGKTSGVQVISTSGLPGSTPNIRVRGYSSNSDMSPLFVVDGILVSGISNIDPNDIESMEVLKDASSAAIYGAQAGNGVVLITTKRGKVSGENWGQVKYDFQYASQSVARKPRMMNAKEYAEFMVEAGAFNQDAVNAYWDGKTDNDWIASVFTHSNMFRHNLAFSNANDRSSIYAALSYLDNDGMMVGNDDKFSRLNANVNVDYKIKSWLKIASGINVSQTQNRGINYEAMTGVFQMDPLTPTTYAPGNLPANMRGLIDGGNTILRDKDGNYYSVSNFYGFSNPLAANASTINRNTGYNVTGNLSAELTPLKGLTITSKFGYTITSRYNNTYNNAYYGSAQRHTEWATVSQTNRQGLNYQWDNYVNYMTTIGKAHDITAMVGHSFTKNHTSFTTGGLNADGEPGVLKDDPELFGWLNFAAASATKTNSGVETTATSESYFGRLNYGYKGRYMAQVSLRADAFDLSKLPLTNRWGFFPAASVAWTTSQENFWKKMPQWFNYLKIRASWGLNGSIGPLSGYLYATTMQTGSSYAFGNDMDFQYISSSVPASMGNDKLGWEKSEQLNFGIDARFLRDRLTFSVDWFNKMTRDLLISGLKPSLIAGGSFSPMNAGSVLNRGFEFELGWRDSIGKDFNYSIRGNLSTLKNQVTELNESIPYIQGYTMLNDPLTIFEKGQEVWHFYGYKYTGLDSQTGEPQYEDINGDGDITGDDRTNIGSAIPLVTYGVTLQASWKGIDLIVFGSGSAGNQIFQALFASDRFSGNRLYEEWYADRWSPSNKGAIHPAAGADISKYTLSSAMVKDGSYFKIKQIQLGYSLPKSLLEKVYIRGLRVYASMDDWFTFTKYTGFDPEASSASTGAGQGVDVATYPISKKLVFGVNLTF